MFPSKSHLTAIAAAQTTTTVHACSAMASPTHVTTRNARVETAKRRGRISLPPAVLVCLSVGCQGVGVKSFWNLASQWVQQSSDCQGLPLRLSCISNR